MADKRIRLLVKAEVKKAIKDLNKLEHQTDDNKKSASGLTGAFKTMFGAAVLGAGIKTVVDTAATFESLQTRLIALKGNTHEASASFNAFTEIAKTTPFQVKNVVNAGIQLEAYGLQSEKATKQAADLAAFMGVDIVEASAAMGRAFAGGAGAADVLRDRGILQLIKDSQGIDDLTKLTLPQFRKALEDAMTDPDGSIAGSTDLLAATFTGKVSNMKDGIDQLANAIGVRMIGPLGDFAVATGKVVLKMADFVKTISDEFLARMTRLATITGVVAGTFFGLPRLIALTRVAINGLRISVSGLLKTLGVGFLIMAIDLAVTAFQQLEVTQLQLTKATEHLALAYYKAREALAVFEGKREEFGAKVLARELAIAELNERIVVAKQKQADLTGGSSADPETEAAIKKEEARQAAEKARIAAELAGNKVKKQSLKETLEGLAIEGKATKANAMATIKAKANASVASYIESIFKKVGFPTNLILAGLGKSAVDKVFDPLMKFPTGGSFVTKGRTTLPIGNGRNIQVGDNASGMERIDVTPLPSPTSSGSNITININAPLVDEYVVDSIIPAIRRAEQLNL
tara:strand:- start:150 stop:1874 length:1725 start_codon:yes stop_codon:yes gene_type:complete